MKSHQFCLQHREPTHTYIYAHRIMCQSQATRAASLVFSNKPTPVCVCVCVCARAHACPYTCFCRDSLKSRTRNITLHQKRTNSTQTQVLASCGERRESPGSAWFRLLSCRSTPQFCYSQTPVRSIKLLHYYNNQY